MRGSSLSLGRPVWGTDMIYDNKCRASILSIRRWSSPSSPPSLDFKEANFCLNCEFGIHGCGNTEKYATIGVRNE